MKVEQIIPIMENLTGIRKFEDMTWSQLVDYLKQLGFTCKEGADANVFIHPQKDYVYKIVSVNSGNAAFIRLALKHQNNRFMPKIFSTPRLINLIHTRSAAAIDKVLLIRMEKLKPLPKEAQIFVNQLYNFIEAKVNGNSMFDPLCPINYYESDDVLPDDSLALEIPLNEFYQKYAKYKAKQLIDFLEQLDKEARDDKVMLDLHSGNVMMRTDGSLVLIDPFVNIEMEGRGESYYAYDPSPNDLIKKGRT